MTQNMTEAELKLIGELRRNHKLIQRFKRHPQAQNMLRADIDSGIKALISGNSVELATQRLAGNKYTPPSKCWRNIGAGLIGATA